MFKTTWHQLQSLPHSDQVRKGEISAGKYRKQVVGNRFESGFSSEHSLIKNFKKTYRLTPTEYRRENQIR